MKNEEEFWVLNVSQSDVSLSDLGLKVQAGNTVNVYQANPYLTKEQVTKSLESGSLFRRINDHKVLKQVTKKPKPAAVINKLHENDDVLRAKKTKTSVIIDTKDSMESDDGSFEFADYGVDVNKNSSAVSDSDAVFIKQKEDEFNAQELDTELVPKTSSGPAQRQTAVLVEKQSKLASNPMGRMAESSVTPSESQPFVIFTPEKVTSADVDESYDAKVATTVDDNNATVMKFKEEQDTTPTDKPRKSSKKK